MTETKRKRNGCSLVIFGTACWLAALLSLFIYGLASEYESYGFIILISIALFIMGIVLFIAAYRK